MFWVFMPLELWIISGKPLVHLFEKPRTFELSKT